MRLTWGLALLAVLSVSAACSSDGDAEPTPSDAAPATSTTVDAPSTTADTSTTTTTPPTTAAPTTTIDPTDALIAEIEADLNEGEQAFLEGAGDPASEASRTTLARYFTDSSLANLLAFYDVLVEEQFVARPNPEVPSVIVVSAIIEADGDDRLLIEFCRVDAGVVVQPLADGSEIVVNDEVIRYDLRSDVVKRNDVWASRGGGELLSEQSGVTECG